MNPPAKRLSLVLYTLCHLLVDTLCFYFLFGVALPHLVRIDERPVFPVILLIYNLLAFGLQFVWGLLADRFPKLPTGFIGLLLIGGGLLGRWMDFTSLPPFVLLLLLLLVGSGNAAFHVEGGRDSFVRSSGREIRTGIFATGGAAGVMVGPLLASVPYAAFGLAILWLAGLIILICLKREAVRAADFGSIPEQIARGSERTPSQAVLLIALCTLFLFVQTLTLPGLDVMRQAGKAATLLTVMLAIVLLASRFCGGLITFRFGANAFIILAALTGALFLTPAGKEPLGLIAAALMLGIPTARVTFQYYRLLPRRPALAYSLQKIPMFLAASLLLFAGTVRVVPVGGMKLQSVIAVPFWVTILIILIVYNRMERRKKSLIT